MIRAKALDCATLSVRDLDRSVKLTLGRRAPSGRLARTFCNQPKRVG